MAIHLKALIESTLLDISQGTTWPRRLTPCEGRKVGSLLRIHPKDVNFRKQVDLRVSSAWSILASSGANAVAS